MQRRLLVIALVFVAGFGVGYGITWLLVGSSSREVDRQVARGETSRPALGGAAAGTHQPDPAPTAPDAATSPDAGPTADADAANAAAPVADTAVAATAETVAAVAADAEPAPKAAWEACYLHACRVDFGKVTGGISIRKGSLEHGKDVDWDKDFAKADKIGTLDAGANVKVEVLAIALENGEPAAAYILRKTKREELKGVIALRIGDKALRLVPLAE